RGVSSPPRSEQLDHWHPLLLRARREGAAAATPPTSVMNSRHLMYSPQAKDNTLPQALLCITAFWPARFPQRVAACNRTRALPRNAFLRGTTSAGQSGDACPITFLLWVNVCVA